MLKHRIYDVYKDNYKLFSTNNYILNDESLSFLANDLETFDLICKYDYGVREILVSFLDSHELDYNLQDMQEAIYMNLLKNYRKYKLLYESDAAGQLINPSNDYKITRQYGEEEKHFNYGARSAQDSYSSKQDTNVYGQGQSTTTKSPRSTDSQDSRTTFNSTNDYDTTHNVTGTIQTTDTIVDATRTDNLTEGAHSVSKTELSHSDGVIYDEHTDNVYGYKGNPTKNIEVFRKYLSDNTIKTIVSECINTVTYSIYLYTGQM